VTGSLLKVEVQANQLRHFLPLVEKVIAQTKERVWGGNRHVVGKVLSLFEPHTQVIRKGKAHKPNEFGRLVRVDEVEHGIVSGYEVLEGNAADTNSWLPAIELSEIERLAGVAIFGTLSETYRTCGRRGCHCQTGGPKHGPHLNLSYRGEKGKTTGYYVPKGAEEATREGVAAWQKLQECLRELAELNKERNLERAREAESR